MHCLQEATDNRSVISVSSKPRRWSELQRNAGGLMCDGGAGRKISDQTDKQSRSVSHPD